MWELKSATGDVTLCRGSEAEVKAEADQMYRLAISQDDENETAAHLVTDLYIIKPDGSHQGISEEGYFGDPLIWIDVDWLAVNDEETGSRLHIHQYGAVNQGCSVPRHGHEPLSEQRLAIGCGSTSAPARRPGRCTRLERGLDGGDDEPRGLRVDDDVPAEQNAADDLPGMRGRVVRADLGGLGHTRTVEETVLVRLPDTPDLQRLYGDHRAAPARAEAPSAILSPTVRFTTRRARVGPGLLWLRRAAK
jgi:hypothetical protein